MWFDILLQVVMILGSGFMYLWMHDIPRKFLDKFNNWKNKSKYEAKRHFVKGAQLLAQAKSTNDLSLARSAEAEAQAAVDLNPSDAAAHILKAAILDLQGYRTSALASIDAALSPLAVKSLSDEERGDALYMKAKLWLEGTRVGSEGGVDTVVVENLREALRLRPDNAKAWCLLGQCLEATGSKEAAKEALQKAIKIEPDLKLAREWLDRLGSS